MGMSISGVLVVGLPFNDVCQDSDEFYEKYEDIFDRVSQYYDASDDDCVLGYVVASGYYTYKEVTDESLDSLHSFKDAFKDTTGLDAKVYVMPHVS